MTIVNQDVGLTASSPYIAGDSLDVEFSALDAAGDPLDISTATIRWELFRSSADGAFWGSPVLQKDLDDGIEVTDGVGGVLVVTIEPEDTQSLVGDFYHEVEAVMAGGAKYTLATGRFRITAGGIV